MEKINCEYKGIWPDTDIILVNVALVNADCPNSKLKTTVTYDPKIHKMSCKDALKMFADLGYIKA